MSYSRKFSVKKALLLISLSFFTNVLLFSCIGQNTTNQYTGEMPELTPIEQEPINHYKTLQEFSPEKSPENSALDAVFFPKKAHQLAIKIISPAYLSRKEIDSLIDELQHPANSSEQTREELDFLLELQASRTEEQIEEALRMHEIVYFPLPGMKSEQDLFFEAYELLGEEFNPKEYPKTQKLLHNIMKEMRITEFTAKNLFLRARPRQLESKLSPLKKMNTASYASGHTLWAYMQAYLMGELLPEKRAEFLKLAYEIGYSREVLGVHYPSDEEASRKLAHKILAKMWLKSKFMKDFSAAKLEWKR